jgi:hypothetical protein
MLVSIQAAIEGFDEVLLAHASGRRWWRLQDRDAPLVGDPAYPGRVGLGALLQDGWLDAGDAHDIVEEVDQVLWALQPLDIAVQNDAIPARVHELDSRAQQL